MDAQTELYLSDAVFHRFWVRGTAQGERLVPGWLGYRRNFGVWDCAVQFFTLVVSEKHCKMRPEAANDKPG